MAFKGGENSKQKTLQNIKELLFHFYCFTSDEISSFLQKLERFPSEGLDSFLQMLEKGKQKQDAFFKRFFMEDKHQSADFTDFLKKTALALNIDSRNINALQKKLF